MLFYSEQMLNTWNKICINICAPFWTIMFLYVNHTVNIYVSVNAITILVGTIGKSRICDFALFLRSDQLLLIFCIFVHESFDICKLTTIKNIVRGHSINSIFKPKQNTFESRRNDYDWIRRERGSFRFFESLTASLTVSLIASLCSILGYFWLRLTLRIFCTQFLAHMCLHARNRMFKVSPNSLSNLSGVSI